MGSDSGLLKVADSGASRDAYVDGGKPPERQPRHSIHEIGSIPKGASILRAGVEIGRTPGTIEAEVRPGVSSVRYTLRKKGFKDTIVELPLDGEAHSKTPRLKKKREVSPPQPPKGGPKYL